MRSSKTRDQPLLLLKCITGCNEKAFYVVWIDPSFWRITFISRVRKGWTWSKGWRQKLEQGHPIRQTCEVVPQKGNLGRIPSLGSHLKFKEQNLGYLSTIFR